MEQTEIIDYTDDTNVQETNSSQIELLKSEINQLENMLKYPMGFKAVITGSLLGYLVSKKLSENKDKILRWFVPFQEGKLVAKTVNNDVSSELQSTKIVF